MNESNDEQQPIRHFGDTEKLFCRLDDVLEVPLEVTVSGAAALLVLGFDGRTTAGLDVFSPFRREVAGNFRKAAGKAGIPLAGNSPEEPREPYIQIIDEQTSHMPSNASWMEKRIPLWRGNRLLVWMPPFEMMAASKLSLGRNKDFDDVRFLFSLDGELEVKIRLMAEKFSVASKTNILENLGLLRFLSNHEPPCSHRQSNDGISGAPSIWSNMPFSDWPEEVQCCLRILPWFEPFDKNTFLEKNSELIEKAIPLGLERVKTLISLLVSRKKEELGYGTARDRHVEAVEHFRQFGRDRSHFITLLRTGNLEAARAMIDAANHPIEPSLRCSDPAQHQAMLKWHRWFRNSGYHRVDPEGAHLAFVKADAARKQREDEIRERRDVYLAHEALRINRSGKTAPQT